MEKLLIMTRVCDSTGFGTQLMHELYIIRILLPFYIVLPVSVREAAFPGRKVVARLPVTHVSLY